MKKYNFRRAFSESLPTEVLQAINRRYWDDDNIPPCGAFAQAAHTAYTVIEERRSDYEIDGTMIVRVNRHIRKNLWKLADVYAFPKQTSNRKHSCCFRYPAEP